MKLSHLSQTLIGSEIVKLGGEIKERIRQGERIYNFTVGDFDPAIFPIPKALEDAIVEAYRQHFTNYPLADGNLDLREAVSSYLKTFQGLTYAPDEILVASGGRPLIYAFYRAVCDRGDKVIYAVPSWNNNHYTHFVEGEHVVVEATAATNFMPTAEDIRPHIQDAALLSLCSPQNPTGTTFSKEGMEAICNLVVEENKRRGPGGKSLYLLYDQMYWHLTYGAIRHYDPVSLNAGNAAVYGVCGCDFQVFAATGVRVGWSTGPKHVLAKMKAILSHVGAWAPMAEQKAVARFLPQQGAIQAYLDHFKTELEYRLRRIYDGIIALKKKGLPCGCRSSGSGLFILRFNLTWLGKKLPDGELLLTQSDVTAYLLQYAKLAIVPFYAFGAPKSSSWYRLSVGTCKREEVDEMLAQLGEALAQLR
jgi:aspartate aminotransferase